MANQGQNARSHAWTTATALSCGAVCAVLGGTIVALSFWAGGLSGGPSYQAITNWLWNWQTLIGAVLALGAAYFTIHQINKQLVETKRQSAAIALGMYRSDLDRILKEADDIRMLRQYARPIMTNTRWAFNIANGIEVPENYPNHFFTLWDEFLGCHETVRATFVQRPGTSETEEARETLTVAISALRGAVSTLDRNGSVQVFSGSVEVEDEDIPFFETSTAPEDVADAVRGVSRKAVGVMRAINDYANSLHLERAETISGIRITQDVIADITSFTT